MRLCIPSRFKCGFVKAAAKDERGATAVEFAMVLGPFLMLLFGIISVGFYFFALFSLEHAIEDASRQLRTGSAQTSNKTAAAFKSDVCSKLPAFMKCTGASDKVRVNVQNSANYTVAAANCTDNGGNLISNGSTSYNPGAAGDVIVATVCFEWDLGNLPNLNYWISPASSRMGNGSILLSAATVFTTEPYN
jgi:Flp pilus assembly protein TadG